MKIFTILFSIFFLSVNVMAADTLDDEGDIVLEDETITSEFEKIADSLPDMSEIIPPSADTAEGGSSVPDIINSSSSLDSSFNEDFGISPLDSSYGGAWSGSVLDYFSGVMRSHPFSDYVCFRSNQYTYVLYYGIDIQYINGYFSGSDLNLISYSTNNNYNNEYISVSSGQSLNYSGDGIFYSNVSDSFASLEGVKMIEYLIVLAVLLCVLLFVSVFRMLMKVR